MSDDNLNKKIDKQAFVTSIILHIVLALILSLTYVKSSTVEPSTLIPIDVSIKEIVIEKPTPLNLKKTPSPTKKPTRLPGDRKKPKITSKKEPFYPKDAINETLEGTVTVKITINTRGRISKLKIIKSSGHKSLDQAFINTLKSYYSFKPKRVMGVNKTSSLILSYTFKL